MLTSAVSMSPELAYVRITKLRNLSESYWTEQQDALTTGNNEGPHDGYVRPGYSLDGWFLEVPFVGRGMVVLRLRRNREYRLGLSTSSALTLIGDTKIQTVNSVYQIENRTFDQSLLPVD